jgi:enoyl-CoA hydratase/carnithine racemase
LTHTVGPSNAALMLFTGDPISATQALAWGLVSELVSAERLLARAWQIAGIIAQRPPIAAETAKINLRAAYAMFREEAIRYERDLQTICFATEDAAEGRNAFKEKRSGIFQGK